MDDSDVTTLSSRRRGDIYTKVAMPRSKSFMNVSGQYNLQELFKELREKEGIESIDDILRQVINPNGMSFNKISPMYRELLMKLAMSMSGDEMFIRSKNIMMQEKMKLQQQQNSGFGKVLNLFGVAKKTANNNHINNNNNNVTTNNNRVNKADIGNPIPMSDEKKRQIAQQWIDMSPQLAQVTKFPASTPTPTTTNFVKANKTKGKKSGKRKDDLQSISCSECGYQSLCGTNCSCSAAVMTTTAAEDEEDDDEEEEEEEEEEDVEEEKNNRK